MKKIIFTLAIMLTTALSASAMSYEQAREQALFLTDKMAYELDLNESQYEAAYEVNLDYLMSITTADDVYADYWTRRNLDLSYILYDWQYRTFCGLDYFYRPLYWGDGFWHFRIFAHYPHHDFFYFGRPGIFMSYRGGHSWGMNGGHSWYMGRHFGDRGGIGMRGGYDRGGYRNMSHGWRSNDGGNRGFNGGSHFGGSNSGSRMNGGNSGSRMNGGNMGSGSRQSMGGNSGFGSRQSSTRQTVGGSSSMGSRQSSGSSSPSRSFAGSRQSMGSSSMSSHSSSSRSFSGSSSMGSRSSSFSGGSSSHSFSGGSSSMGGGMSHGGGSSMGGGSHGGGGFGGGSHGGGGHR